MGNKTVEVLDLETGEVKTTDLDEIEPKRRNGFTRGWTAMSLTASKQLASSDLGLSEYRVFHLMIAHMDYENWVRISQTELAEELGMGRANFSRSLNRLVREGFIVKGPKQGRSPTYRISPECAWRGAADKHKGVLSRDKKVRSLRVIQGSRED